MPTAFSIPTPPVSTCFIFQQRDEAGTARVRPHVGAQQVAQFQARAEGGLALADPFEDAVAPLPVAARRPVLIDQVEGEIHLAALRIVAREISSGSDGHHVFLLDQVVGHAHDLVEPLHVRRHAHQQRRQLMGL